MADEIRIELVADANGVIKAIEKTAPQAEKAGEEIGENLSKGISTKSKLIAGAIVAATGVAAVAAAAKLKEIVFDGIAAAQAQDDAVQRLNASLRNTGNFSESTSKSLQEFASGLQAITTFGDEVILDQLAFAQAMGASVSQSKAIVAAATDMSAALGMDFNSAVRNISRTLGGFGGELSEIIPSLKNLTKEQLQSGAAIDLLAQKYQGFAQAQAKTFTGAMDQLGNVFGDLSEKVGESVVTSDFFIRLINTGTEVVNNFIKNADFSFVVDGLKAVASVAINVFEGITKVGLAVAALTGNESLQKFLADSFAAATQLKNALNGVAETQNTVTEATKVSAEIQKKNLEDLKNSTVKNTTAAHEAVNKFEMGFVKASVNVGNQIKQTFIRAMSAGIQHFTLGLMKGKMNMDGFAKSMAGMLGDMAIQIGETLMLSGLGIQALFGLSGAAAVAAGAGLIALGSILKSFSGGSDSASTSIPAPTAGFDDTTAVAGPLDETFDADEPGALEKQQVVSLTVQGDILDSEETGTRLLAILNDEFENKNGRLVTT